MVVMATQQAALHAVGRPTVGHPSLPARPAAGATPTDCGSTPEGGELLVPFTATITCWACK